MKKLDRAEYDKLRRKAMYAVKKAIKAGDLKELDGSVLCVDCGDSASVYDHRDYEKPLDVEPVCRSCNGKRGASIQRPVDWNNYAGKCWSSLSSGGGDEYLDTQHLAINVDLDELYDCTHELFPETDPDVRVAMKELAAFPQKKYKNTQCKHILGRAVWFKYKWDNSIKKSVWIVDNSKPPPR